ncbi:MAG: DUF4159 domain-containing protein [Verrucomicrobiota bacterium]
MKLIVIVLCLTSVSFAVAQQTPDAREEFTRRNYNPFPEWKLNTQMPNDVFRFARLRYDSYYGYGRHGKWATDFPDSDLNFSYRLHELTSLEVHPNPIVVDIDAEQLADYPFIYMIEPGNIYLNDREAKILRDYLLNGGFIMVDDFWGTYEWENFIRDGFKKIFPEPKFEPQELPLEHPIFHCVFDLKEKPQVPAIGHALQGRDMGITYEWNKPGTETAYYKGVFDEKGRMMMIICHNTDLGDGWEREGENEWYFREFAEKKSFPMGINIVFYAMTH